MSELVPLKKQKTMHDGDDDDDDDDNIYLYQGGEVKDSGITNVVVKEGLERIDDNAFQKCRWLVRVSIPDSVTYIGSSAFYECKDLETIVIPDGVKKIEVNTFFECTALEEIDLPNSITSICENAFRECHSLQDIVLPDGVKEIRNRAFMMSGIEEFVVPDGIKVISDGVFGWCFALQAVELPSSIERMDREAFSGCYKLENFVLPNGLPKLTKLNLDYYEFGVQVFDLISQLVADAPNLEELSLQEVEMKCGLDEEEGMQPLSDDDTAMSQLVQVVSLCPSLRTLIVSHNSFTPNEFETLASLNIPQHLRRFEMYQYYDDEEPFGGEETMYSTDALLSLLQANPKLGILTDKFWSDAEDENVMHHLEMNLYGCRGFTVLDALWPLLIERLAALERKNKIETGAENILYHLLPRHSELLLRHRER